MLGLGDSAIVTKGIDGQIRRPHGLRTATGKASSLADSIFGSEQNATPTDDGIELDSDFVEMVVSELGRGGSALLFFLDVDSLSDLCELLDALAPFSGTLHQTTVPPPRENMAQGVP